MIDTEGDCAEWTFPAVPGAVRSARHAVHEALRGWGLDDAVRDMTVLLVSELVTNSLQYTTGPIGVRLQRPHLNGDAPSAHPGLLVEVSDPLPDPPTERSAGPDDEGAEDCSWWPVPRAAGGPGGERAARRCGSSCPCLVRSGVGRAAITRGRSGGRAELGRKGLRPCCDRERRVGWDHSAEYCGQDRSGV